MDFSWSSEQKKLYDSAYDFARKNLKSNAKECNSFKEGFLKEQWRLCADFGIVGGCVPLEYGGKGWDALTMAYILEALAYAGTDRGLLFSISAHLFACAMPIARYGSASVKSTILPLLCTGSYIGANAITEEQAGSDAFALSTTAELKGDNYIINGSKNYVTNGSISNVVLVYAKTAPEKGYLGTSCFLVDCTNEKIKFSEPFGKLGLNSAQASKLTLHSCEVPLNFRLGNEGEGMAIFNYSMQWERACLFAIYVGMMALQLDYTIKFVQGRKRFGKLLSEQPLIKDRIAHMKARLESSRLLLYKACWSLSQGQNAKLDILLSKFVVSQASIDSSLDAIHLHGAQGIMANDTMGRMLRDAIPASMFSGTSEIISQLIAVELGL